MNQNFSFYVLLFLHTSKFHSILPKSVLSSLFNISYSLHSLNCLHIQISVVLQRFISFFLELKDCVVGEFFIIEFTGSFSPCEFSRVMFGFEVAMTFWSTKSKGFAIISHEHDSMARIDWSGAKVTPLDSHQQSIITNNSQILLSSLLN